MASQCEVLVVSWQAYFRERKDATRVVRYQCGSQTTCCSDYLEVLSVKFGTDLNKKWNLKIMKKSEVWNLGPEKKPWDLQLQVPGLCYRA